jgi:hypothetical protein
MLISQAKITDEDPPTTPEGSLIVTPEEARREGRSKTKTK